MKTEEVIKRFAKRIPNNRRDNRIEWECYRAQSIFSNGPVRPVYCTEYGLYSYGNGFCLAYYLGIDPETGEKFFLKNGDRSSPTTNRQQVDVQKHCFGPTASFAALREAGIHLPITRDQIIDWRPDRRLHLLFDTKTGLMYHKSFGGVKGDLFPEPEQGVWVSDNWADPDGLERGYWHVLGAMLIRTERGDFLCSLDEGSYFVTLLVGRYQSVQEALDSLVPDEVKQAIEKCLDVRRQGEWFFVATGMGDVAMASRMDISKTALLKLAKMAPLPQEHRNANTHDVKHVTHDGVIYARGKVFHRTPAFGRMRGGPSGEHKTLDLGSGWFRVYRNVQQESWSMGGKFD